MRCVVRCAWLSLGFCLTQSPALLSQDDYSAPVMAGISNHGKNGEQPYVTAGDRAI